jgi:cell division protease FtsH
MILLLCILCSVCPSYSLLSSPFIKNRLNHLNAFQSPGANELVDNNWIYSDLFDENKLKLIESVTITEDSKQAYVVDNLHGQQPVDPTNLHMIQVIPSDIHNLIDNLVHNHIHVSSFPNYVNPFFQLAQQFGSALTNVAIYLFAFSLVSGFIFRNNQGPGGMNSSFMNRFGSDNEFQVVDGMTTNTTFSDVAGCDEAKFELMEVVDYLKNPDKYEQAGAKIPKGVLLEGSPGTGKTLLARAVAGEAGVPFISASGSEFIEMFVGVGASRVRNLFENANKNAPCVIFIDEIDAVGRQRGAGIAGGNDEREQTLNQILTNMDGFSSTSGIIVIAATNRADILDNALTRPGRFDRKVRVPLPSLEGRQSIFGVHLKNKRINSDVDIRELATITTQFSGADIANLANEAAILSVRKNSTEITRADFFDAFEKVTIGLTSNVQETDPEIIDLVCFHETGHAFMASLFNDMFDLRKVTINGNTGGVGGYTLFTPKEKFSKFASKRFLLANLIIALGGRAAEIYLYKNVQTNLYNNDNIFTGFDDLDVTTGASNDLMQANNIARNYITKYGFGDNIGLYDSSDSEMPFMGREMSMSSKKISEHTRTDIDSQTSALVKFAYLKAIELIKQNDQAFLKIVGLLREKRTIGGKEVQQIVDSHSCQVVLP